MDPLSVAASVLTVASAAGTATKCAHKFYIIACKAGAIRKEIEFLASQIDSFAFNVSTLHSSIRNHYMSHKNSVTLDHLTRRKILNELALQTNLLMDRWIDYKPNIRNHRPGIGLLDRLRWVLRRSERRGFVC